MKEQSSTSNNAGSRPLSSVEIDEVGELEKVSQAVTNLKNSIISSSRTGSPKCHSRSSSHDSYFERKLASSVVQFNLEDDGDEQSEKFVESPSKHVGNHFDNASLDLSEIQVNFELEDNEMKIFSEDEAMLSNSCGSDLSKSIMGNSIFDDDSHLGSTRNAKNSTRVTISEGNEEKLTSPKNQRMSFREKFRIFTSPNSGRKTESADGNEEAGKRISIKDKVLGTLSPESLRKRNNILGAAALAQTENQPKTIECKQVSPMKKKSSSPTLGTSPNSTAVLVKRSKIEHDDEDIMVEPSDNLESPIPFDEGLEVKCDPVPCGIPLSPSIQFMDESTESTSKINPNSGMKCF